MYIQNLSSTPSFGAIHISTNTIKKKIPFTPFYKKVNVEFVELEKHGDLQSITDYIQGDQYNQLGRHVERKLRYNDLSRKGYHAYAITCQHKNLTNLDPKEILGLCDGYYTSDYRDKRIFFIDTIETKSKNNNLRPISKKIMSFMGLKFKVAEKYKGIGKTIINNIIKLNRNKIDSIQLEAMDNAKSFYKHLGFKDDCPHPDYFRLTADKFDKVGRML